MPTCPTDSDQLDELLATPTPGATAAVSSCPGDFVVLGAAGKMGLHLTRMIQRSLRELGRANRVIAVSRFSSRKAEDSFRAFEIETRRADLSVAEELESLPDAENVFFMAGVKFGTGSDTDLLHRMNVVMPRLVAIRYRQSRIVALSTGCVYSFVEPESGGSKEQDDTDPPGDYARSCIGRERAFVENSVEHGTRCALIRLNYSIELRYGVLVDIAMQVFARQPVDLQTPYVNVIWQRDAIDHIVQSLPHAATPPWILNVTGADTLSVRDIAMEFGLRFGCDVQFVNDSGTSSCWLSNSSDARRRFGEPDMPFATMVDWIATWIESGGPTLGKPTKFQVRDGNY